MEEAIKSIDIAHNHLKFILDTLKNPKNVSKSVIVKSNNTKIVKDDIHYLIHKLISKYKHKDIKNRFHQLIYDEYISIYNVILINFKNTLRILQSYQKILNKHNAIIIKKNIKRLLKKIIDEFIDLFTDLTDFYFLRRFLDKNYITNGIVYTGASHSANYINILVKNFDFKVTHLYYPKITNYDDLNKQLANYSLDEIFNYLIAEELSQCVDMTDFPKNFN